VLDRISGHWSEIAVVQARALLAATIVTSSTSASAVQVSQNGLGQVLLYPYYTTHNVPNGGSYNTLFIFTNTTADTKVVRVRFRESRNGRPVASLNVYLVPNDSWAAAVVPNPDSGGAALYWNDRSCTDPPPASPPYMLSFSNAAYSGPNGDFEDASLARATEGYFEVFELGVIKDPTVLAALKPVRTRLDGTTTPDLVPDCPTALAVPLDDATKIAPPTGGLMGSAFLINVYAGTLYSYDATSLDDFTRVTLWSRPGSSAPTLDDVNPKLSRILDGAVLRQSSWDVARGARPADPVSVVLMKDQLLNYFVRDTGTASGTDWIVTMPTKPSYVSVTGAVAPPPSPFESTFNKGGAPDSFDFAAMPCGEPPGKTIDFDREGFSLIKSCCCGVPPGHTPFVLSWTANVVSFSGPTVFGSGASVTYQPDWRTVDGWLRLAPFPDSAPSSTHKLVSTDSPPVTYFGLPMIGFMANSYTNGAIPSAQGNLLSAYGATSPHRGVTRVE